MLKVRDKKTNKERIVTRRAYEILKKRYQILEDLGNDTETTEVKTVSSPNLNPRHQVAPVVQGVPDAEPVADEVEEGITINPGIELTQTVERKKPGPKPKSKLNA